MPKPRRSRGSREVHVQLPLETYFREIHATPLLSAEEERSLALRIESGDAEARDHLIRANLRLVVRIARQFLGRGLELGDLIEEGNLGLLRAAEEFDAEKETRFSTYAVYWVRQAIKRAIVNTAKVVRVPAYMSDLVVKWNRAKTYLADKLGRPPAFEEVAEAMELPKRKVQILRFAIHICESISQTERPESLEELAVDTSSIPVEESPTPEQVAELVARLDPGESLVIKARFGLAGCPPKTLKDLGEELGMTRGRVRQIENEALAKLAEWVDGPT